nr:MAG TPA: hypothetical protein [Caudoviricetes sp.]
MSYKAYFSIFTLIGYLILCIRVFFYYYYYVLVDSNFIFLIPSFLDFYHRVHTT